MSHTRSRQVMTALRAPLVQNLARSVTTSPTLEDLMFWIFDLFSLEQGQENKVIKKGKKGTTFNRVISKRRPVSVGVKNLLNVKSCYHLSCSGNDRANLLARKAEA